MMKQTILILLAVVLSGCAPRYIEVPKETIKESTKVQIIRDTIRQKDSVIVHEMVSEKQKGDTVYVYRTRIERVTGQKEGKEVRTDTVYLKEKKTSVLQKAEKGSKLKTILFELALVVLLSLFVYNLITYKIKH